MARPPRGPAPPPLPDLVLHKAGAMRLKRCRHGTMLFNIHDLTIGRSLDLYGEFSEAEVKMLRRLVRPGDVVLDIGANIGCLTVPLARHVEAKGGVVVALEPQPILFQNLCANVALGGLLNVRTVNAAAGETAGSVRLPRLDFSRPDLYGAHAIGSDESGELAQVIRLDDALRLPSCRLIKIDVEGMEAEVIRGARGLIERHRPILYVENDRREKSPGLIALLFELGYTPYWHLPPLFGADNLRHATEDVFRGMVSINMICAPPGHSFRLPDDVRVRTPQDWWRDLPARRRETPVARVDILADDPLSGFHSADASSTKTVGVILPGQSETDTLGDDGGERRS